MSIFDDWKPYLTPSGLVNGQPNARDDEGNAILRTAQYAMCLAKNGVLSWQVKDALTYAVRTQCEVWPGIYRRAMNWKQDQIGRDDMIALACLDYICGYPFSKQVLGWYDASRFHLWGPIKLKGAWDNVAVDLAASSGAPTPYVTENKAAWLGRHIEMVTLHEYVGGRTPAAWHRWFLGYALAHSGSTTDQDGWILGAMMCDVLQATGAPITGAIETFRERLAAGPGTLNAVFAAYFNNAQHPLALHWNESPLPRR